MARSQIVGLLLGLCLAAGCSSTASDDAEAEATATGTSSGQTDTSGSSSSLTATASASVTTSTSGSTTGVGGAAGNANATSETSTTAAGGSGEVPCPSEAPAAGSECSGASYCVYEDCTGAGRSIATCSAGAWSLSTTACSETFPCQIGGGQCNAGEICLIHAGGAISTTCVPNTCGTGPVECDCAEGCADNCRVNVIPEQGITITCNTCPNGMLCP